MAKGAAGARRRPGPARPRAATSTSRPCSRASRPDMAVLRRRDVRPGRLGLPVRRRGRRGRARQRRRVRPQRLDLHPATAPAAARVAAADPVRHGQHQRGVRRDVRAASTRRWAACASPGSAAGRAPRASCATPRPSRSRRSGCSGSAPMLGLVRRARTPDGDDRAAASCSKKLGRAMSVTATDYDVLVVGSGFGGSVAALRLTEKGYRVGVLEAGARFDGRRLRRRPRGTCGASCSAPRSAATASSGSTRSRTA